MIVLADRNFAAQHWLVAVADTGADLLVRVKIRRNLPVCRRLSDGSYLSRIGQLEVRVITATITVATDTGRRSQPYRLITTVLDPACPPAEIVALYHQRWEIETAFFELKSTILGGRVLRARTPPGINQEIYALLVTYQALRIAISDAVLTRPESIPTAAASPSPSPPPATNSPPPSASSPTPPPLDLVGMIGRQSLITSARPPRPHQPPRGQTRHLRLRRQQGPRPNTGTQPPDHHHDQNRQQLPLDIAADGLTTRLWG